MKIESGENETEINETEEKRGCGSADPQPPKTIRFLNQDCA
jgi:hypothetical protein